MSANGAFVRARLLAPLCLVCRPSICAVFSLSPALCFRLVGRSYPVEVENQGSFGRLDLNGIQPSAMVEMIIDSCERPFKRVAAPQVHFFLA